MSTIKAALKAAKIALDSKNWDEAINQAQNALSIDKNNNFAYLFIGRAEQQKGKHEEAEKAYNKAAELKPDDTQAWLGLRNLFEQQGPRKVDEHTKVGVKLAELYATADDKHRAQAAINSVTDFAKKHGTRTQYHAALQTQLPTSPIYSYLEGRLPHPFLTYVRLAEITELEEDERIKKLIAERRTRLGARLAQVTVETKREIYTSSSLEHIYQCVIDWCTDDEVRREYEEKLFQRAYDTLVVLPPDEKATKLDQVRKLVDGMVIIRHPYRLAWELWLEWKDVEDLEELDVDVVHQYIALFPDRGLAKVLRGFMATEISPWPQGTPPGSDEDEEGGTAVHTSLNPEDRLVLMTEGVDIAKDSYLAFRLMADYYLHLAEYESAVEIARKALASLTGIRTRSGLLLQGNLDAVNSTLAASLVHYQAPRHHPEAKVMFESILQRKKTFGPALIGIGLILEEEGEYEQAMSFLQRALTQDPTNFRIGAEAAWCKALMGDYKSGLEELQSYSQGMEVRDSRSRTLKGQTMYRIGMCQWDLDKSKAARKDRKGAYASFLACIKTDPSCAPAYTALGTFYEDYARDRKRARQCFQKAFELSPAEVLAAERMARSFAGTGDWEIVEAIAQRVVGSGHAKPTPGSKKRGVSWPFSALGVVQMGRLDYQQAIVSFLAALRIKPDDYHSYIGLGESYHNSGRYQSALRAFRFAQNPPADVTFTETVDGWFTEYMLANVHRELGDFGEAVAGYTSVLKLRPREFGVSIALLQTLTERAWRAVESGFFGQAIESATEAIEVAAGIVEYEPEAFNLWKSVGDCCAIYASVQVRADAFPVETVKKLLHGAADSATYAVLGSLDQPDLSTFAALAAESTTADTTTSIWVRLPLVAAVLAHKRAVAACMHDIHAQAVAWYNLGWSTYRAHVYLEAGGASSVASQPELFLQLCTRSFKRAIELEAGNSDFWNSLGVVTSGRNPRISQHALVRSLHLEERSPKVWTNLGALCMLQGNMDLAHQTFARAQSTDPDYAPAWVGEGTLAMLAQKVKEAHLHFTHAYEIGTADATIVKEMFVSLAFDLLLTSSRNATEDAALVQPLMAAAQLHAQEAITELAAFQHVLALLRERAGDQVDAVRKLTDLAEVAEADYEKSESTVAFQHFLSAKADLARNLLANGDEKGAIEAAQMVLDLTTDAGAQASSPRVQQMRLSAHLTVGIATFFENSFDDALAAFRAALTESDNNPDAVCLLAQILWARGSPQERAVAREQLFQTIEKHSGHVESVLLLGIMGIIDHDNDVCDAVRDELEILRTSDGLNEAQRRDLEFVLEAVASASSQDLDTIHIDSGNRDMAPVAKVSEAQNGIMLGPAQPQGWSQLAELVPTQPIPGHMAIAMAMSSVPPMGDVGAEELAEVLAKSSTAAMAQRSIAVAPWGAQGWEALRAAVSDET